MERTLLLVDDEENILRSIVRVLRRDGYKILTANSGKAGLELLETNQVGVIVSDQRMPQMTGVEFLSQVKDLYPETVRIVLSGYTELSSITDAINQGAIYKFLTKPWEDSLLRANIEEAFQYYELRSENERLSGELIIAYDVLSTVNLDLEKRVEDKAREVKLSMRAAQVSQDILENLPIAVLGIGEDGTIATANKLAYKLLQMDGEYLIGSSSEEILPESIYRLVQHPVKEEVAEYKAIEIDDKFSIEVCCCQLTGAANMKGVMLLMRPSDQSDEANKKKLYSVERVKN
jgi:FixJ family two-component response regulator